jgi:hypothetical protein
MQSEKQKTALPVVAGILSLVSGGLRLLGVLGILIASLFIVYSPRFPTRVHPVLILVGVGIFLIITGVLAVVGGIYTLHRRNFGLSLAGAIASLLPFNLLGVASVVLLALSKKEFE